MRARPTREEISRRHIQIEPSKYLRRFYFDTIIHSQTASEFLIKVVGPQRVMFGTDFPFDMGASSPVAEIEAQRDLSDADRVRVFSGTALEFLRLRSKP